MSYITGMILDANDASPKYKLGAVGLDYRGYQYKYLQYKVGAGSVAAVAGNAVGYYAPGGVSAGSYTTVTSDVSDTAGVLAGVLQAALTADYYGWFQTKGPATIATNLVSGADGNGLTLSSTTDGTLKVVGAHTDAGGASAIDASANIVMLNCP